MAGDSTPSLDVSAIRQKARVLTSPPAKVIAGWLKRGCQDFRQHLVVSLAYGSGLAVAGWTVVLALGFAGLGWLILPAIAGAMVLGPAVTVGLYRISRRAQGLGGTGIAAPGQIMMISVVMMVLALMWIRAATLLFAVFFGLRPFAGFQDTLTTLVQTQAGIMLFLVGSAVGGLFAVSSPLSLGHFFEESRVPAVAC